MKDGKEFAVLGVSPMTVYRVLAQDKVVYVLYDVDADTIRGTYTDANLRCPACGLWSWMEREIATAVRAEVAKGKAA